MKTKPNDGGPAIRKKNKAKSLEWAKLHGITPSGTVAAQVAFEDAYNQGKIAGYSEAIRKYGDTIAALIAELEKEGE